GSNAPTGGMTGLALDPSAFFGWDKEWVGNTWGSVDNIIEIKVPHQYIRQPAMNDKEIYFEGGLKRVDEANNIWEPIVKPRDTFYNRLPATKYDFKNDTNTLKNIWERANEDI
ncbi:unnamed protein product, partial [marine sediment metagenome]